MLSAALGTPLIPEGDPRRTIGFGNFFLLSGWSARGAISRLAVAAIAAVNNYLLPAWMIGFGVIPLRLRTSWRAR